MNMTASPWHSLLYVPANSPRFIDKAHERGADAIILDLEDSVPVTEKSAARMALADAVPRVARGGSDVLVRINQPLELAVRDIETAVMQGVAGLMLPKVEGASHVRLLDELVTRLEAGRAMAAGSIRFILIVETPGAWLHMAEIFRASSRNFAAALGSEDFSLECDAEPVDEVLLMPKQQLIITARAHGLHPLGLTSSIAGISEPSRMLATARRSRSFGFSGATCVHPTQVQAVNQAFSPTAEEIAHARAVVDCYEEAEQAGKGAAVLEGRMVDAPVVQRARHLLSRLHRLSR